MENSETNQNNSGMEQAVEDAVSSPPVQERSFDEILSNMGYQSEFDRRVDKALKTAKIKWQKEAESASTAALKKAVEEATEPLNGKIRNLMISASVMKASARDAADVLPLLNQDAIQITDEGIEGLEEQIQALKQTKPYLFQQENPSSAASGLSHGDMPPEYDDKKIRRIMGIDLK